MASRAVQANGWPANTLGAGGCGVVGQRDTATGQRSLTSRAGTSHARGAGGANSGHVRRGTPGVSCLTEENFLCVEGRVSEIGRGMISGAVVRVGKDPASAHEHCSDAVVAGRFCGALQREF